MGAVSSVSDRRALTEEGSPDLLFHPRRMFPANHAQDRHSFGHHESSQIPNPQDATREPFSCTFVGAATFERAARYYAGQTVAYDDYVVSGANCRVDEGIQGVYIRGYVLGRI